MKLSCYKILNAIILVFLLFAFKVHANVEVRWVERGCEDGAKAIGNIAAELELEMARIIIETEPKTPTRSKRLKLYNEKYEKIKDIISAQRNNLKRSTQDNLALDRIELWYGGATVAVDLADIIIERRINSNEFGATSERYRRLIEDECRAMALKPR